MTCRRCGTPLYYNEVDNGVCDTCADILWLQHDHAKDWAYYHDDDETATGAATTPETPGAISGPKDG